MPDPHVYHDLLLPVTLADKTLPISETSDLHNVSIVANCKGPFWSFGMCTECCANQQADLLMGCEVISGSPTTSSVPPWSKLSEFYLV
jgi:hypothetical protein